MADLVEGPQVNALSGQRVTEPVIQPRVLAEPVQEYHRR
jgi:hypothetical protein